MRHALTLTSLIPLCAVLVACGESPPEGKYVTDNPPETAAPAEAAPVAAPETSDATFAGLTWHPDADWRRVTPDSSMRLAQFEVGPRERGAEVVVFHFGPGQGGSVEDNLLRWARLVLDEKGEPTLPEITEFDSHGLHITSAVFHGTYLAGPPGGEKTEMKDWTLYAAIVEGGPEGSVFPRMVGPNEIVIAEHDAFERFLRSAAPAKP